MRALEARYDVAKWPVGETKIGGVSYAGFGAHNQNISSQPKPNIANITVGSNIETGVVDKFGNVSATSTTPSSNVSDTR